MGYLREPKNVDLVVGPSVFTEETRNKIIGAIAQYKKTGKKPVSVAFVSPAQVKVKTNISRFKSNSPGTVTTAQKKRAKI